MHIGSLFHTIYVLKETADGKDSAMKREERYRNSNYFTDVYAYKHFRKGKNKGESIKDGCCSSVQLKSGSGRGTSM